MSALPLSLPLAAAALLLSTLSATNVQAIRVESSLEAGARWTEPYVPDVASDLPGFLRESGICAYAKAPHGLDLPRVLNDGISPKIFQSPPRVYPDLAHPQYILGNATTQAHLYIGASGWTLACFSGYPLRDPAARAYYPMAIEPYRLRDAVTNVLRKGANITDPDFLGFYDFSFPFARHLMAVGIESAHTSFGFTIPATATIYEASASWHDNFYIDDCRPRLDGEPIPPHSGDNCANDYGEIAPSKLSPGYHEMYCSSSCSLVLVLDLTRGHPEFHNEVKYKLPIDLECPRGISGACPSITSRFFPAALRN